MNNTKVNTKNFAIIAIVIVFIVIMIMVISGGQRGSQDANKPFEAKVLEGEELAEAKEYGGLDISNVKLQIEEQTTSVTADVVNNTGRDVDRQYVNINLLDKDGKIIDDLSGYIGEIKAGETGKMLGSFITSETTNDICNVEITAEKTKNNDTELENNQTLNNSID